MKFGSLLASSALALNIIGIPASHSNAERLKPSDKATEESPLKGADPNIVTFYRHDPLASTFDVVRKASGYSYGSDGAIGNSSTNLRIFWNDSRSTGLKTSLVTGLQGGSKGAAVDLGTQDEMNERYKGSVPKGYSMFPGDWFTTLQISGKRVFATFRNGDTYTPIPIPESSALFPATSNNFFSVAAKVGHVYVLRQFDPGYEDVVFKVLVLAMTEDSITVRFALMRNEDFTPKPRATPGAPVK